MGTYLVRRLGSSDMRGILGRLEPQISQGRRCISNSEPLGDATEKGLADVLAVGEVDQRIDAASQWD